MRCQALDYCIAFDVKVDDGSCQPFSVDTQINNQLPASASPGFSLYTRSDWLQPNAAMKQCTHNIQYAYEPSLTAQCTGLSENTCNANVQSTKLILNTYHGKQQCDASGPVTSTLDSIASCELACIQNNGGGTCDMITTVENSDGTVACNEITGTSCSAYLVDKSITAMTYDYIGEQDICMYNAYDVAPSAGLGVCTHNNTYRTQQDSVEICLA